MKIGMIVAIQEEIDTLLRVCGTPLGVERAVGYTVYRYAIGGNEVLVTGSGIGEIAAASAAQYLVTKFGVELLVNYGVCGGLTEAIGLCCVAVVEKAVHYGLHAPENGTLPEQYPEYPDVYLPATPELVQLALAAEPALRPVICASADIFVEDPAEKARLHRTYGAEICEMEAAGILLTAHRNQVPVLLIKGVSDSVAGGMAEFETMVHESAAVCLRVLVRILEQVDSGNN